MQSDLKDRSVVSVGFEVSPRPNRLPLNEQAYRISGSTVRHAMRSRKLPASKAFRSRAEGENGKSLQFGGVRR
jgi:hypothetical protein